MFLLALNRSILFALQSFWRNIWLSLATIFIIFLTLLSVNFLIAINGISNSAIFAVQEKIDVSLYLKTDVRESKISEIKSHLETLPQVKEIIYNSAEANLKDFTARHQGDTTIQETLTSLDGNPLGATLIIKAKSLADYPEILKAVDNPAYADLIEEKSYDNHELVIERINLLTQNVKKGGFIVTGIFALIAILIVFNTVRIAIFTHQNEVSIMKLVGASNWFIRAPFIIESVFCGLIACFLSIIVAYFILYLVEPHLANFFGGTNFDLIGYFNKNIFLIVGGQLISIIILNIFSSALALGKYLKV